MSGILLWIGLFLIVAAPHLLAVKQMEFVGAIIMFIGVILLVAGR